MNPDLSVTNAPSSPQIENPKSKIENALSPGHKRNGKIARLPKSVRNKINQSIDDGRTYPQIIKELGDDAKDLKPKHFSEWRKGGYEDYLRHQEWRDQLRILRENGSEMTEFTDGPKFQETLIQIALTEIFRVLQEHELKPDSLNYIRLFNALARLNREALGLRKYNDLLAKQEAELKKLDIGRNISTNERRAIVAQADQIFRMPRPRPDAPHDLQARTGPPSPDHEEPKFQSAPPQAIETREGSLSSSEGETAGVRGSITSEPQICSPAGPTSSVLPSNPCPQSTPSPHASRPTPRASSRGITLHAHVSRNENRNLNIENCLDCGSPLPPVPPDALRRPEDHCPNPDCGMRLPDIGLCSKPGFDRCLNCGATQPALLPNGDRPRPTCHKCGIRLHNPELPPI